MDKEQSVAEGRALLVKRGRLGGSLVEKRVVGDGRINCGGRVGDHGLFASSGRGHDWRGDPGGGGGRRESRWEAVEASNGREIEVRPLAVQPMGTTLLIVWSCLLPINLHSGLA